MSYDEKPDGKVSRTLREQARRDVIKTSDTAEARWQRELRRRQRRRNPLKKAAAPLVRAGELVANGPNGYVRREDDGVVRFFQAAGECIILGVAPREWVRKAPTYEAKETARQVLARRIPPTLPKKQRGFVDRATTTGGNALGMKGRARGRG